MKRLIKNSLLFVGTLVLASLVVSSCEKPIDVDDYTVDVSVTSGMMEYDETIVAFPYLNVSIDGPVIGESWQVEVSIPGESPKSFTAKVGQDVSFLLDFESFRSLGVRETMASVVVRNWFDNTNLYSDILEVRFRETEPNED